MKTDVSFLLSSQGRPIPVDHAYPVYSALSRILPELHTLEEVGIHPICGIQAGNQMLMLTSESRLVIRIEPERIATILPLAGKSIGLGQTVLQIGVPTIHGLAPSPILRSRLVTIKGFTEPKTFCEAIRRQLDAMEVSEQVGILLKKKERKPTGELVVLRRTLRIHEKEIVGFEVFLTDLSDEESIRVQEIGLGGRRKMGCGMMIPAVSLPPEYYRFREPLVSKGGD